MSNVTEEQLRELINSNKSKSVLINNEKYWIGKKMKEAIKDEEIKNEKEGGFLPLLALIPLIGKIAAVAGGIGATAGGIATAVQKVKEIGKTDLEKQKLAEELKQLQQVGNKTTEIVQPFKGKGIFLNPYQGKGIYDFIKNLINQSNLPDSVKTIINETGRKLKFGGIVKIKESKHGLGIYLRPVSKDT